MHTHPPQPITHNPPPPTAPELEEGTDNLSVGARSFLELPDFLESNQIARSQIIYH